MGLRKILTEKEPALHKVCKPVEKFDGRLRKLLEDMRETLIDSNGVGLAAPQVGILRRAVVIDVGDGLVELINPEIIEREGAAVDIEGCLSIPGRRCTVERPERVTVRAMDRKGRPFEFEAEGFFARAVCHELDHLDGVMYVDKMIEDVTDQMEEEGQAEAEPEK